MFMKRADRPLKAGLRWNISGLTSVLLICSLSRAAWADSLKFAWPVPARVTVTETALKRGKTAKMRYDMVLDKQASGKNLELRFDKFELLEIAGLDLTVKENKEKLAAMLPQLTALQGAMPTLVIDSQGEAVDVVGIEQTIDKALKILDDSDPKIKEAVASMLRSPQMLAQIKEKTTDFWKVWVQTWVGQELSPGQQATIDTEIPLMGAAMVKTPMTIKNEGAPADNAGYIQLSGETTLQGENVTKALAAMMQLLSSQMPVKEGVKPFSPDMVQDLKRTTKFTVVTNPKTLQPLRAQSEITTDLTMQDQHKIDTEKHDYTFEWGSGTDKK